MEMLSKRLRELRAGLNITQREMAEKLKVSPASLSSYESGNKLPPLDIAMRMAEGLNVSLDWLCGREPMSATSIKTYAEIAKALVNAIDADMQMWRLNYEETYIEENKIFTADEALDYDGKVSYNTFASTDPVMSDFLKGWANVRKLYLERIVDNEMYEAWLEKRYTLLSQYDIASNSELFLLRSDLDEWHQFAHPRDTNNAEK